MPRRIGGEAVSMKCECGSKADIVDSRPKADRSVGRRYVCRSCGAKWVTSEIVVPDDVRVTRAHHDTYAKALMVGLRKQAAMDIAEKIIEAAK